MQSHYYRQLLDSASELNCVLIDVDELIEEAVGAYRQKETIQEIHLLTSPKNESMPNVIVTSIAVSKPRFSQLYFTSLWRPVSGWVGKKL